MFFTKAAVIILLSYVIAFSQNFEKNIRENFLKENALLKVNYPGDSAIDIKYYFLNLKVTYNPNYLRGSVTIKAAPSHNSLSSFFLDLQDQMKVDSILSSGNKVQFNHSDAKLNITLNRIYNINEEFEISNILSGFARCKRFWKL